MRKWKLGLGVTGLLVFIAGCKPHGPTMRAPVVLTEGWVLQDAALVKESGDVLSNPSYAPLGWHRAVVPGTVLTSLVADKTYPEPLYGENNRPDKIPESLGRANYWYREQFAVPDFSTDERVWLNFDGINYAAEVWVNGTNVGAIHGAFSRGQFDVTPWVSPGTTAAVAVRIVPPPHPGNPLEQTQLLGTGPNGGILAEDGPTFIASIGWDWIPAIRDRNIGIWQNVSVKQTGPIVLGDPFVFSDLPLPRTDSADLTVSATITNVTDKPKNCDLTGAIEGATFGKSISLNPHQSRVISFTASDTPQLHITNPRLWWPNGYGKPDLYVLHLQCEMEDGASDSRDVTFGIRKITYHVPGTDNLTISVNGVPVICKGGDWGMDEAMKRIPRDRLEAQIRMHQFANYTMIRNWVGQSTEEDFYDLCDRYGIMLWDEFFQPNPSDGPNPVDVPVYLANVREKILRFRNHPSIAVWCARNEGNPPPAVDAGIQTFIHELDPVRLYQKNSNDGKGVRSGGPYSWRAPRQFYNFPPTEAFKTELGSVSIPTLQAIQAMMPRKDWWPLTNDDWAEHDLLRGAQNGDTYPKMLATRYGPLTDLPDFVRKAQLANFEAYRAMYEGRFAKLFNPVTAVLTWMSNPAQPSMVWQLYSHDLEPNASLFAVHNACEPVHVQLNQSNDHVQVINAMNVYQPDLRVRIRIFNLDGTLAGEDVRPLTAVPDAATDAGLVNFPAGLSPVHFVKLELLDGRNHAVSENFYWRTSRYIPPLAPTTSPASARSRFRRAPTPQEDFTDLQQLPEVPVDVVVTRHDSEGKCSLTAMLTNRGETVALLTHLQLRWHNATSASMSDAESRVLPVAYSDNYISLLPSETRTVQIEAALPDLHGGEPLVFLDGWNVAAGSFSVQVK